MAKPLLNSERFRVAVGKDRQDVVRMMVEQGFNVDHLYQVATDKQAYRFPNESSKIKILLQYLSIHLHLKSVHVFANVHS